MKNIYKKITNKNQIDLYAYSLDYFYFNKEELLSLGYIFLGQVKYNYLNLKKEI